MTCVLTACASDCVLLPTPQDIFSLFHLDRPFKFVSKTSNFYIPIVGWSMFLTGGLSLTPLKLLKSLPSKPLTDDLSCCICTSIALRNL